MKEKEFAISTRLEQQKTKEKSQKHLRSSFSTASRSETSSYPSPVYP